MAISIAYGSTYVISVPQADLTLVSGTLYELDTNAFRLELKDLEDSVEGIPFPATHRHNTEVTVAGTTFARTVEIIPPYSVEFEDGQYTVRLVGSNNNIFDVENGILVQNQVQVIPGNSAGLITVVQGSGVTAQDKTDIINGVWAELLAGVAAGDRLVTAAVQAEIAVDLICNNGVIVDNPDSSKTVTLYEDDGTTIRAQVLISADGKTRTRIV